MRLLLSLIIDRDFERTGFVSLNDGLHNWNSGTTAVVSIISRALLGIVPYF
jgi:uncharacterized membrane protein